MKKHIVTIGGGTGHYRLLTGLKNEKIKISAIVSMADDGGSTGVLRDEYGALPPGDVRQCLVALSRSEPELRDLFSYRYVSGPFKGHSFGNLFLTTLEKTQGSFNGAVKHAGKILNIYGRVIPVTLQSMRLVVSLKNGMDLFGEKFLDSKDLIHKYGVEDVYLANEVSVNRDAIRAVQSADAIVLAPGDIYGSILPNLLVKELAEAINSSEAKLIYISSLTNKKGISEKYGVDEYVDILTKYIREPDVILVNKTKPSKEALARYKEQEGEGVVTKLGKRYKNKCVLLDLLADSDEFIRHDSGKLAKAIMDNT